MTPAAVDGRAALGRRSAPVAILLAGFALALPLLLVRNIPLYDLPDHLARMHLLYDAPPPGVPAYYIVQWRPLPNLALEAGVFLLHQILSIDAAVRIFLVVTVLQLFLGTMALNRALFGGSSWFALAAALFVFNGPLLFGFVNLSFGVGMALWVFALWIRRRQKPYDWLIFPLLASVILFCHLFAFAVFALAVASYAGAGAWHDRKAASGGGWPALRALLRDLLPLAVPTLLNMAIVPPELEHPAIHYAALSDKLASLLTVNGFYNPVFDAACLVVIGAGAILIRRDLVLARAMVWPLAALGAAFLALPHQIGAATFVDYRVPSALALFLIGSVGWRAGSERTGRRAELLVLGLLLVRTAVMCVQWSAWQPVLNDYHAAFAKLPIGARLLPLQPDPDEIDRRQHPPLAHVAALAVADRRALIPSLFADLGHQLLAYAPAYAELRQADPTAEHAAAFDYVLLIRPDQLDPSIVPPYQPIDRGPTFILGRLIH